MIAILIALLLSATPAERLAQIRRNFPLQPKAVAVAALERLVADAPDDPASAHASLWLGGIALQEGDLDGARRDFERADRFPNEIHRLALRGQGDVAYRQRRYSDARRLYQAALVGAPPTLAAELTQKVALSIRARARELAAFVSLFVLLVVLLWFGWRIRRPGASLRLPLEALYVAPVYALLILACVGRDPPILYALELGAAGSLAIIFASGLAQRRSPARPWLHALAIVLANLALFYLVVYAAGIMDTLLVTVRMALAG